MVTSSGAPSSYSNWGAGRLANASSSSLRARLARLRSSRAISRRDKFFVLANVDAPKDDAPIDATSSSSWVTERSSDGGRNLLLLMGAFNPSSSRWDDANVCEVAFVLALRPPAVAASSIPILSTMGVEPYAAAAVAASPLFNVAPVPTPPSNNSAFSSPNNGVWPEDRARKFIASRWIISVLDNFAACALAAGVRIGVGNGLSL